MRLQTDESGWIVSDGLVGGGVSAGANSVVHLLVEAADGDPFGSFEELGEAQAGAGAFSGFFHHAEEVVVEFVEEGGQLFDKTTGGAGAAFLHKEITV